MSVAMLCFKQNREEKSDLNWVYPLACSAAPEARKTSQIRWISLSRAPEKEVTKRSRVDRKQADPNQLSLLDYVPVGSNAERKSATRPSRNALRQERRVESAGLGNVLTAQEAARYLKISLATLKSWRAKKTGPAFVRRGARLIGYLHADLDDYLRNQG